MEPQLGFIYHIINKKNKYFNAIGILLEKTNAMVSLYRITPRTQQELLDDLQNCHGCIGFATIYPRINVNKRSIQQLLPHELTPEIRENIIMCWNTLKHDILSENHGIHRAIIHDVEANLHNV